MKLNDTQQERLDKFMTGLRRRNPGEQEFHQAVYEVAESLIPFLDQNSKYEEAYMLERLTEPDRIVIFRVPWQDDEGNIRANRGYRVQFSNAIGPYKGGIRFHPSVSLSILKFLAFEQIFKNSLTTLPMGGGKGGSNFNPKGKSEAEVMRFCQSFMIELSRHIGKDTDVPAGDIGVGAREVGYMYGMHKRLTNKVTGVLTGKGLAYGGSLVRKEATGYGAVYFARNMMNVKNDSFEGKKVIISGAGNVALHAAEKCLELGAKVLTLSDSGGTIYFKNGMSSEQLEWIQELKEVRRGRISEVSDEFECEYLEKQKPWGVPCDIALPCATQNEITGEDAKTMIKNGCMLVSEGANMPSEIDAVSAFLEAKVLFAPGKAANAGGVTVSGFEMAQNSQRLNWSWEELDAKLQDVMLKIHDQCVEYGREGDYINYAKGANVAGFVKVADALLGFGVV